MSIRFFITRDFIRDCMNPNKTIYLFGGKFNSPTVDGNISIVDKDNPNNSIYEHPDKPYDPSKRNLGDYNKSWYKVDNTGNIGAISINDLTNGDILPCTMNNDRTKVQVKIPYYDGLQDKLIGYLTYFTEANPDNPDEVLVGTDSSGNQSTSIPEIFRPLTEKVGFVFESQLNNIGIVRSTENPNDSNSHIEIDLSKLNISANLQPIRYRLTKDNGGNFSWNKYETEHLHNLVNTVDIKSTDKKSGFDNETGNSDSITESFIDVRSLKENTKYRTILSRNTYIPELISKITEDNKSIEDSYIITNDGRYINSDSNANNSNSFVPLYVHKKSGLLTIPKFSIIVKDPETGEITGDQIVEDPSILLVSGFNPSITKVENEDGTISEIVSEYPDAFDHALLVSNTTDTVEYRLSTFDPYDTSNI